MTKFLTYLCITLLLSTSGLSYLLRNSYKENGELNTTITTLTASLATCNEQKQKHVDAEKAMDILLEEAVQKQEKIDDVFGNLSEQLEKSKAKRCPSGVVNEQTTQIPNSITSELESVRLLLDKAACTANSNCSGKPSESPSKAM